MMPVKLNKGYGYSSGKEIIVGHEMGMIPVKNICRGTMCLRMHKTSRGYFREVGHARSGTKENLHWT